MSFSSMMVSLLTQTGYPSFLSLALTNVYLNIAELNEREGLRGGCSSSRAP